jgi:hypothetical protein
VEFDFFRKIRFIEQRLWNPDPPRVADPDNTGFRGHCDYSVATWLGARQVTLSLARMGGLRQGALGDMGAHLIDHPYKALTLGLPTLIFATRSRSLASR